MGDMATAKNKAENRKPLTNAEFFEYATMLEDRSPLFYAVWSLGKPVFSNKIPTACVEFDDKGLKTRFIFNPDFWAQHDEYNRCFFIAHEALHIALNHGTRTVDGRKNTQQAKLINIALDIVVNHSLTDKFKFRKKKITEADQYAWIETIFGNKGVVGKIKKKLKDADVDFAGADKKETLPPKDKAFEYYYRLLKEKHKELQSAVDKGVSEGKLKPMDVLGQFPDTVDEHESLNESGSSKEICKELNDMLSDEEKNEIKETIEKHFEHNNSDEQSQDEETKSQKAGSAEGGIWKFIDPELLKTKRKRKFETVIQRWVTRVLRDKFDTVEQWAKKHRRIALIDNGAMFLPCEMDVEEMFDEEDMIDVFFFMDTSGSCSGYQERFFKAAASLPEDKFNVRSFVFDTSVHEIELKDAKMRWGGGTSFRIIEDKIQEIMANENISYPKAIFVLTDGYGDRPEVEHPEPWYWFVTHDGYGYGRTTIPSDHKQFDLRKYE